MFSQRLSRMAGPALTTGGLLWITIHVLVVLAGLLTGKLVIALDPARQPLLAHIYYALLPISYLIISIGLLSSFVWLKVRTARSNRAGLALASLATLTCALNLLLLPTSAFYPTSTFAVLAPIINGLSGLSALAATLVLGCATLRTHSLPAPLAWTLIVIGIVTLPLLLLTPLPIGPGWASDTIAFFLSGTGFTIVGVKLLLLHRTFEPENEGNVGLLAQAK